MHQHFRSRYLIDTLHSLGFCAPYKEALKFERCAVLVSGSQLDGLVGVESFIKYAADNVDHNLRTLDGQNTFHGMGMIASIAQGEFSEKIVPRKSVSDKDLSLESKVKILIYREKKANVEKTCFRNTSCSYVFYIQLRFAVENVVVFPKPHTRLEWVHAVNTRQ